VTFDQSAIYRAETQILAAYRAIYGEQHEPSPVDLREWALALLTNESKPRVFADVGCSQCGARLGPGPSGFSHCSDHRAVQP